MSTEAAVAPAATPGPGVASVGDADFEAAVLGADRLALVYFWSRWCGPCRLTSAMLEELAPTLADKVSIFRLDVDTDKAPLMRYGVRRIPTLILFRDGAPAGTKVGALSRRQLLAFLDAA